MTLLVLRIWLYRKIEPLILNLIKRLKNKLGCFSYSDGVEINCGCPQRWALSDGYGAALLSKPELISDLIKQCRGYVPNDYTISAKIRLQADYRY